MAVEGLFKAFPLVPKHRNEKLDLHMLGTTQPESLDVCSVFYGTEVKNKNPSSA